MFLCSFLALCCVEVGAQVEVLISTKTPEDLRHAALQIESQSNAFITVFHSPFTDSPPVSSPAVLDLLWSEPLSRLHLSSSSPEVPTINGNEYQLTATVPLDIPIEAELRVLTQISQWLGVRRICALLSPLSPQLPLIDVSFQGISLEVIHVQEDANSAELDRVVRKMIIPFGFTSFLIVLSPHMTKQLLLKLDSNQMTTNRLTILLSSRAAQYRFTLQSEEIGGLRYISPLLVTQRNCSAAHSVGELLLCQVQQSLSAQSATETDILQITNTTAQLIGKVRDGKIELSEYQESQLRPNLSVAFPAIAMSVNGGEDNPSGPSHIPISLAVRGATLALQEVNSRTSILPFSTLEMLNITLGVDEFSNTWVRSQLKAIDLGVVHLQGPFSSVAYGVYSVLRELNYSVPQVGATTTLPQFSSRSLFPLFTRVAMSDAYLSVVYTRMMKHFEWSHVCMVYNDNLWCETLAELITSEAEKLGIQICNTHRKVPVAAEANSTEVLEVVHEVVDSKVRVLMLIAYQGSLLRIIQALYDSGMRSGDLVMVAVEWLMPSLYDIQDASVLSVVTELTQGAIMFYPASFVGAIGASLIQKYAEEYHDRMTFQACYYYDAVLSIAHALDFVVAEGLNWRSPPVLDAAIRDVRFTGCSGLVTLEDGTNDRSPMSYTIFNARKQTDGSVKVETIGDYDPSGVVLFRFSEAIQWPGRSATVPADTRGNVPGCPFEPKHDLDYQLAQSLSAAVISGICVFSMFSCLYIWKKYWHFGAKSMRRKVLASFEDYFVFVVVAVEALQQLAVGLRLQDWAAFLQWSARLSAVRFEAFATVGSDAYWGVFFSAVGAVALWTLLLALARVRTECWSKCVCKRAGTIAKTVCPILGDIAFIPIVSTLLAIFQCPKVVSKPSEDPSLYRAYLEWDCHQHCWSGFHLAFALVALICLLIYVPSATYLRPAWQHVPLSLHIHSSPAFLMLKSAYQILIVSVDRAIKTKYPVEASITFLILTALYGVMTIRFRPFSYCRANLWHFLSTLTVAYTTVLHILYCQLPFKSSAVWLVLLFLGSLALCVFGLVYQRFRLPPKLMSRQSIPVAELFRFMFSRGPQYLHIFSRPTGTGPDTGGVMTARRVPVPPDCSGT